MFRIPHVNVIQSDSGFSIEVLVRTGLLYVEEEKTMKLDSEVVLGPSGLVLYTYSIKKWLPPHEGVPVGQAEKDRIVENIREAFRFCGIEIAVQ